MSLTDALFDQQSQFLQVICSQDSEVLAESVIAAGSLSTREALNVYVQDYWLRLPAALADLFPSVAQALSRDDFEILCCDYLRHHPSQHYNLDQIGESLPGFLSQHPLIHTLPYLAELAELEKSYLRCFHAPDLPEPDWNLLETQATDTLYLDLIPNVYHFKSQYDLLSVWTQSNQADLDFQQPDLTEVQPFLVYHYGKGVRYRRLNSIEDTLFRAFQDQEGLEQVLESVLYLEPEPDPTAISQFFGFLRKEKLIKSIYIR